MRTKWFKILFLMIISALLVLLDTSFFSFLTIYDASIIISFLTVSIFAIKLSDDFFLMAFFVIVFFTIFSSVPPWITVVCFLIFPSVVYYFRSSFLPEPSFFAAVVYFLLLNFAFDAVLLANSRAIDAKGLLSLAYFVVMNTIAGVILFNIVSRIGKLFDRGEIKGI